jgi:hypothetical protein
MPNEPNRTRTLRKLCDAAVAALGLFALAGIAACDAPPDSDLAGERAPDPWGVDDLGSSALSGRQPAEDVESLGAQRDVFTPFVAAPIASPRPVLASDGRRHILYELQMTSTSSSAAALGRVETIDPATGEALVTMEGAGIVANAAGLSGGATLAAGATAYLFMHLPLAERARVPARLVHRFTVTLAPELPGVAQDFRSGPTRVSGAGPVVAGAPLVGARWVAVNGCCAEVTSHRGALLPINGGLHLSQRFAIDFVQLGADGRLFVGPPDALTSYRYYGTPVLSVAPGVVVRVRDGLPDNVPGTLPPDVGADTAGGNHVVVDLGGGRFAFYAHLKPGSLRVEAGDRVGRGRVLGLLGNSGNSTAPHLHFHVMDTPSPLGSDGLPYVFRAFRSEGTVSNGEEVLAGAPAAFDGALRGTFADRLPLDVQSVDF